MKRWTPRSSLTKQEQIILKRLVRVRKLFAFLRLQRDVIFDQSFQDELEAAYRQTGAGLPAIPPALLCMVMLLQSYVGASDAEAVELALLDLRWQMVLDCLGAEEPPFSQGTLFNFRQRLIATNLDLRLLERTIEVAKKTKEFDWKKLPKSLRIAVDSRPLVGAGRVEDTVNLIGHAARNIALGAAKTLGMKFEDVCTKARIPILLAPSVKAGLDLNWSDPKQKSAGVQIVEDQVSRLVSWVCKNAASFQENDLSALTDHISILEKIEAQDLRRHADGSVKVNDGVAADRIVSIADLQMRHGRKSKSKKFNGYKEHIAADLDSQLILATAVTPANALEESAAPALRNDLDRQNEHLGSLHIDRGYINSELVDSIIESGGEVICKPWAGRNTNSELFGKRDFKVDMRSKIITCPAGEQERFEPGDVVHFDPEACGKCSLRAQCTLSASGKGRTVSMRNDENLQHRLRKLQASPSGRERLRERVGVEHRLAHIAARKGPVARYVGVRKNQFDLRRAAAIQNLETIQRRIAS